MHLPSLSSKHLRYARNFLTAVLVGALLLYGAYRRWGQPDLSEPTLAHFHEHADDYNILFFGSSISRGNIDPIQFDRLLGEKGFFSHSMTLGIGGADMHQIDWAIRVALRARPSNLKYVFIDLRPFALDIPERNQLTPRAIRWHDPHQTLSVFKTIELADASPYEKRVSRRTHEQHFLYKYFPLGTFLSWPADLSEDHYLAESRGYTPYDISTPHYGAQNRTFMKEVDHFRRWVGHRMKKGYGPFSVEHYNLSALQAQIELIRSHGATPVYWTAPSTHDYAFAEGLKQQGVFPHLLMFDDPARFPELFEPGIRLDDTHLDQVGTALFMPLLVDAFLQSLEGSPDLPPVPEANPQ